MNKRANNNSFLPRIMIAIALIAIFGVVLWGYFGQDTVAVKNAKEAYEQYLLENPSSKETDFIYIETEGTIVAIRNGSVLNREFSTEAAAVKAATNNASVLNYTLFGTSNDKLYSVKLFDPGSNIFAVGAQKLAANAISMNVKVVSGGMIFANFDIPAEAIANKQEPVEITIRKIDPKANVTLGKNQDGFAYDIDVNNLVENNTAEIGVTINGPKGLAQGEQAITVYHNSSRISSVYNPTSGQVSFKTTHFSPYTFTYEVVEVDSLAALREQLAKKGGVNIRLTGPITITMDDAEDSTHSGEYGSDTLYFVALVFGDKTIDLNGQTITYSGSREDNHSALFCVNKNSSLTITDSSNSGNGGNGRVEIKFDTYAVWSVNPTATVNIHDGIFVSDKYAGVTADTNAALLYSSGGKINVYGGYYLFDSADGGERNGFNVIDQAGAETYIWVYEGVHLSSADFCDAGDKSNGRVVLVGEADLATGADSGASTREIGTDAGAFSAWHTVKGEKIELKQSLHTDKYIYRVGNRSPLPLGAFFNQVNAPTGKVSIRLVDILATKAHNDGAESVVNPETGKKYDKNDRFSGYYEYIGDQYVTIPSENYVTTADSWADYTVQIPSSFYGPARLELYNTETNAIYAQLYVEVVAANNVSTYSELKNASSVLLSDITMSSGGTYALSGGTLYGNGFTFDVTKAAHAGTGTTSGNYIVSLNGATLDNVQIVGAVYENFGIATSNDYNRPVVMTSGNCNIYNSYIANAGSPIRHFADTLSNTLDILTVVNSTLKGGSFANIDMRGGHLILDDVTTINQVNGNDASSNGKVTVGLGIVIWYEGPSGTETIRLVDVDNDGDAKLDQYNYLASNQTSYFASAASDIVEELFTIDSKFIKTVGTTKWVNAGILAVDSRIGEASISKADGSKPDGYDWDEVSYMNRDGHLCTRLATNFINPDAPGSIAAPAYAPVAQYPIAPTTKWEYPQKTGDKNYVAKSDTSAEYCYYDTASKTVQIRFEKGSNFTFDPKILTLTKFNKPVEVAAITMNGQECSNGITFSEEGNYEINYTYVDEYNYGMGVGGIGSHSVVHKQTLNVQVILADAQIKPATFDFNGLGYKTATVNNKTYVMPNVSATSTTIGQKNGVYYPIVNTWYIDTTDGNSLKQYNGSKELSGNSSTTIYCQVFDGVITITDNGTIYDSSNTDMAGGKLSLVSDSAGLKWSSSSTPDYDPDVMGNKLYFASIKLVQPSNPRAKTTYVFEYSYKDDAGNTYYYYVGYVFPAKAKKSTCVTPDTLVTLADGSKKEVQYITHDDQLLIWNYYTGRYDVMPASIVMNHGYDEYRVVTLNFSDGTTVNTINGHGFFDANERKYVILSDDNAEDYIGHEFVKVDGNGYSTTKLVNYSVKTEYTESWSILTAGYYNCILEDMWTVTPAEVEGSPDYLMPFVVGADMKYDAAKLQADIEKYGLYTYEDFAGLMTQQQYEALGLSTWKVAVGKGYITWEDILYLVSIHIG